MVSNQLLELGQEFIKFVNPALRQKYQIYNPTYTVVVKDNQDVSFSHYIHAMGVNFVDLSFFIIFILI